MFNQQPKTTNHTFVTGPRALGGPKGANNLLLKSFTSFPDASQLKSSSPFRSGSTIAPFVYFASFY